MQELINKSNNFDAGERSHPIIHCNILLHTSNDERQRLHLCLFILWKDCFNERQQNYFKC